VLETSSYISALATYSAAALIALLVMVWWLIKLEWGRFWVALLFWLGAAVLLTPAYASMDADTLAPAVLVAVFQTVFFGVDTALHALRPLGMVVGLAAVLGCFHGLIWVWLGRRRLKMERS
jgi:energy-converting hydrogenase Eha subunit B